MRQQINELFKYNTYIFSLIMGMNKKESVLSLPGTAHTYTNSVPVSYKFQMATGWQEGKRKLQSLPIFILTFDLTCWKGEG